MSEHKTGKSNLTIEEKEMYWKRRGMGLRGQVGYVNVHRTVLDEKGNKQLLPLGYKKP